MLREIFGVSDSDMAIFTAGNGERLRLDPGAVEDDDAVGRALRTLREATAGAGQEPLDRAVRRIVETTRLRERLHAIPDVDIEDVDRELDDFLARIANRAADGATLAELADDLRAGLAVPASEEEEVHADAIQLMTSHKAKGLEWDAVIVPYLFRRIEWKSVTYPRVVSLGAADAVICRDKAEYNERARDVIARRERQQCQRLYYVMFTRARRTLVLFDDEALMARQTRKNAGEIAGEFLGFSGGANREVLHALPGEFTLQPEPAAVQVQVETGAVAFAALSTDDVRRAVSLAGEFPRRRTPHALANHAQEPLHDAEPEAHADLEEETPDPNSPGILYGTWWHDVMEAIPWTQPPEVWRAHFAAAEPASPQPERAAREWDLFLRSELAAWLAEPGRLIQVELPFLWPEGGEAGWIEGVMDLAVFFGERTGVARDRLEDESHRGGWRGAARGGLSRTDRGVCARARADVRRGGEGIPLPDGNGRVRGDHRSDGTYS